MLLMHLRESQDHILAHGQCVDYLPSTTTADGKLDLSGSEPELLPKFVTLAKQHVSRSNEGPGSTVDSWL
jgi:hypothetical protein